MNEMVGMLDFMVEPGLMEILIFFKLASILYVSLKIKHGASLLCTSLVLYYILFFILI